MYLATYNVFRTSRASRPLPVRSAPLPPEGLLPLSDRLCAQPQVSKSKYGFEEMVSMGYGPGFSLALS